MKKKAKKAAPKKAAKPVAKKKSAKPAAAKTASRPAAKPADVGSYTPQPIQGMGWAPFRYPLS
jgi:outer membrane biosynthesis protein TonB